MGATIVTFAQARTCVPLFFWRFHGKRANEWIIFRKRRKFSVPNSENSDGQMRCQINAADQKHRSDHDIRDNRQNAKRKSRNGDGGDRALHQRDHGDQSESGSAQYSRHPGKYFPDHEISPRRFISHWPNIGMMIVRDLSN
jgi:hypothetical protein